MFADTVAQLREILLSQTYKKNTVTARHKSFWEFEYNKIENIPKFSENEDYTMKM